MDIASFESILKLIQTEVSKFRETFIHCKACIYTVKSGGTLDDRGTEGDVEH